MNVFQDVAYLVMPTGYNIANLEIDVATNFIEDILGMKLNTTILTIHHCNMHRKS